MSKAKTMEQLDALVVAYGPKAKAKDLEKLLKDSQSEEPVADAEGEGGEEAPKKVKPTYDENGTLLQKQETVVVNSKKVYQNFYLDGTSRYVPIK